MLDQVLQNKEFLGRDGFYWWVGQIPKEEVWRDNISGFPSNDNTESKGFGERYKVRIMGSHLGGWESQSASEDPDIADEDLPWAVVMYPVTAGGGGGGCYTSANLTQGSFVFGFYFDGKDGQQPVIMGTFGYNDFNQVSVIPSSSFEPFTGYADGFVPYYSQKNSLGGTFADALRITGNLAEKQSESVNGSNTASDIGSVKSGEDGKEKTQLPPPPDCKSPLTSMQLQIKNTIQQIEKAKKSVYDFRFNLNKDIAKTQEWIDKKIVEGAKIIAGAVKWLFTEIEKFVIGKFNSVAKKFYNLLMPNEQPTMKEAMEKGSDIIACLFKKIIGKLFDMVLGFLKGAVDRVVNTAECLVNNFLGGLLGQLAGLIDGVVSQAFGAIQSIINGVGGIVDSVLGIAGGGLQIILDVISFLSCEEKPECSTVENWSIWDGSNSGIIDNFDSLIENITSTAESFTNAIDIDNFNFNLDFNNLFDAGSCYTGPRTCGTPTLDTFGSGTGAAINLIVSGGGEILGGDVVNAGYGYVVGSTYTKVVDDCGIGQGGIVTPVFGGTLPDGTPITSGDGGTLPDGTPITSGDGGKPDVDVRDPNGNPTVGIVDIIVVQPGKDYLPTPNGSIGGDGRVWANPEDTNITNGDGTIRVPIPPENPVNVSPGDEVTIPPGTEIETDAGQIIPGGIPTIITQESVLTTPPLTIVKPFVNYPSLDTGSYPVILYLCEVIIDNPGINYSEGDEIVIEPNFGAKAVPKLGDFGKIVSIKVTEGGEGFTEMPKITMKSQSGFNAELIPKFCIDRIGENDLEREPDFQDKVISVIDCVGKFNVPN
jgi:hypothetical protein